MKCARKVKAKGNIVPHIRSFSGQHNNSNSSRLPLLLCLLLPPLNPFSLLRIKEKQQQKGGNRLPPSSSSYFSFLLSLLLFFVSFSFFRSSVNFVSIVIVFFVHIALHRDILVFCCFSLVSFFLPFCLLFLSCFLLACKLYRLRCAQLGNWFSLCFHHFSPCSKLFIVSLTTLRWCTKLE